MNVIAITDPQAPQLDVYARLTQAQLRSRRRPEDGLFIAESAVVIGHALDAGYQPVSLLMERRQLEGKDRPLAQRVGDVPIYVGEREVLSGITGYALTRGVLCAMRRPALPTVEQVCAGARRLAVLEGIVDGANVGAIFRCAAALGMDHVWARILSVYGPHDGPNTMISATIQKLLAGSKKRTGPGRGWSGCTSWALPRRPWPWMTGLCPSTTPGWSGTGWPWSWAPRGTA